MSVIETKQKTSLPIAFRRLMKKSREWALPPSSSSSSSVISKQHHQRTHNRRQQQTKKKQKKNDVIRHPKPIGKHSCTTHSSGLRLPQVTLGLSQGQTPNKGNDRNHDARATTTKTKTNSKRDRTTPITSHRRHHKPIGTHSVSHSLQWSVSSFGNLRLEPGHDSRHRKPIGTHSISHSLQWPVSPFGNLRLEPGHGFGAWAPLQVNAERKVSRLPVGVPNTASV